MSISTYAELQTAIDNWLEEGGSLDLRSPEFIALAESRIANDVRCRTMEKRSTASISSEYVEIPSDFLEIRDIQINSDPIQALTYLSPKALSEKYPSSVTGKPKFYTLHGDEFQFKPIPSTTYTIEISYYARFAAFSADADTNWLLTNHPGVYLYGSLLEASIYRKDDDAVGKFNSLYDGIVAKLNESEKKAKYGNILAAKVSNATP